MCDIKDTCTFFKRKGFDFLQVYDHKSTNEVRLHAYLPQMDKWK